MKDSAEKLSKFLKKHRVYREFIKHIKNTYIICPSLDYYCKKIQIKKDSYISGLFNWDVSKKGFDFWADIDYKWRKTL